MDIGNALMSAAGSTQDINNQLSQIPVQRGGVFPLTTYADNSTRFDPEAGVIGALAKALTAPARAYKEGMTRDEMIDEGVNFAGNVALGGYMMPKPSNALGIFAGRTAKTADQTALAKAEQMAASGAPREQIWGETGWFTGPDGKWRFEIDDYNADMLPRGDGGYATVGKTLDHKDLYAAYPDLQQTEMFVVPGSGGNYKPPLYEKFASRMQPENITLGLDQETHQPFSVMLHEAQHAIQNREGFAPGGDPYGAGSMDAYKRLAGEVEARAVQNRMDMTAQQRKARPPWLDYDVPEANQILRKARDGWF